MTNFTRKSILILAFIASCFGVKAQTDTLAFDTNINKTGYALSTVTIGNYDWNLFQAIQASPADANDMKFGANSIRMRRNNADYGYIEMNEDKATGLGSISFYASRANFSNDRTGNAPIFEAQYSTDQGANWTPAGTAVDLTGIDVLTKYEFSNLNISGNVRIRLVVTGGDSGKRFNIDSLIFTSNTATPASCEAPTNLVLTNNQNGSITVSWTAATTAPALGYAVAVLPTGTTVTPANFVSVASATSYTTDTLQNGQTLTDGSTYDVHVVAVCAISPTPDVSTEITDDVTVTDVACPAPTTLVLTDNTDGSLTASWTAPVTAPAIGYYIAVVPTGTTPSQSDYFVSTPSATTFTTDTLKNGTALADGSTYDVHVVAVCAISPTPDVSTEITDDVTVTDVACPAPTTLVLTDNTDGSLTASWTAPVTAPAIGYYIAVVPTGTTPSQSDYFVSTPSATTFTTDTLKNGTALADGSTYDVYVMAVCAHGAGGYATPLTDDVTITIAATPSCAAPTNLVVTDNANGSITASWTAPATLPTIGYYIAVVPTGTTPAQSDYFTAASSATTFTTDTLKNGTALADGSTYDVYVMAVCFHGAGGYATPIQDDVTVSISSASCQDPANITITDNGNGSVNISWTAPATVPQNGYYYAVVPQGTTPSVPNDYVNTSATSLTNINATTLATGSAPLTGGTTYTFHLRSFCFHGAGGYGNEFENDFTLTLGVNDIYSEISGIYPNPAETTLTIDTKTEEGTISIVDLTGKTIATSGIKGNSTTISVSDLPGGMYQVVLSTSGTTSVSKFVKK